jgi:hypothetical protein
MSSTVDRAYALWGGYSDPEHNDFWLPEMPAFLEKHYPVLTAQLKKLAENDEEDFDWEDVTHGNRPPMYVMNKMAAALRADWMEDERMAAEFVKMVMDTRVFNHPPTPPNHNSYFWCDEGAPLEPEAAAAAEEDSCAIHGPLYGDDICAGCHYASCRPPTKEEMEHWHSYETTAAATRAASTCWGCRENQPNQLAHTDPGGCLHSEEA